MDLRQLMPFVAGGPPSRPISPTPLMDRYAGHTLVDQLAAVADPTAVANGDQPAPVDGVGKLLQGLSAIQTNPYEQNKALTTPPANFGGAAMPGIRGLADLVLPQQSAPTPTGSAQPDWESIVLNGLKSQLPPMPDIAGDAMKYGVSPSEMSLPSIPTPSMPDLSGFGQVPDLSNMPPDTRAQFKGMMDKSANPMSTLLPKPSPENTMAGNAALGLGQYALEGGPFPGAIESFGNTFGPALSAAGDFFLTPEKDLKARETAAQTAAKEEVIDPTARFGPPPTGTAQTLLEFPIESMPPPIQGEAFQQEMPPGPVMETPFQQDMPQAPVDLPVPPTIQGPDYSQVDQYLEQASPQPSTRDWEKQQMHEALRGLAQGAAAWNPRSGWGGLLSGAFAGAGDLGTKAEDRALNEQDAFDDELRKFALVRAENALGRSKLGAEIAQTNANNQYQYKQQTTQQRQAQQDREYAVGQQNRQNVHTTGTENARQRQAQEEREYNVQQQNLKNVHDTGVANSQAMRQYEIERIKEQRPAMLSATKDGIVTQTVKDGKMQVVHHPFKESFENTEQMKSLKEQHGENSAIYKQHLYSGIAHTGNWTAYKYELAKDALKSDPEGLFGENYKAAKEVVQKQLDQKLQRGNKKYAEAFDDAMAQILWQYINITDGQQMRALARMGSQGALYLIDGTPDPNAQPQVDSSGGQQ